MTFSQEEIHLIRKEYGDLELKKSDLLPKPIDQFQSWFSQAMKAEVIEPNAMVLATSEINNPKARYVLFKGVDDEGLIFHTNYERDATSSSLLNCLAANHAARPA